MLKSKNILSAVLFQLFIVPAFSSGKLDSLKLELNKSKTDTALVNTLIHLSREFYISSAYDSSAHYAQEALSLSEKIQHVQGIIKSYARLGQIEFAQKNYFQALENQKNALRFAQKINDSVPAADALYSIGACYEYSGQYVPAVENLNKAAELYIALKDNNYLGNTYLSIGGVYLLMENYNLSLDYYFKARDLAEEIKNDEILSGALNNIGEVYRKRKEYEKALSYYMKIFHSYVQSGDQTKIATVYTNVGSTYAMLGNYSFALSNLFKALRIWEAEKYPGFVAECNYEIGNAYFLQKKYDIALSYYQKSRYQYEQINDRQHTAQSDKSIAEAYLGIGNKARAAKYAEKSFNTALSMQLPDLLMQSSRILYEACDKQNNCMDALGYFKNYSDIKDSVYSTENSKKFALLEMNHELEKKRQIALLEQEKKDALTAEEIKRHKLMRNISFGGFMVFLLFSGYAYYNFRQKHKAHLLLNRQKSEIETQKIQIEKQHDILEEKHIQITDSINYAARIQKGMLLREENLQKNFPFQSFILYRPKDIVSGDFYFFAQVKKRYVIAAADCTGHGVPGGFLSMMGNSVLNEIVNKNQITDPGEILERLHHTMGLSLNQRQEGLFSSADGMDISLCTIDTEACEIAFAGAMNPLFFIISGTAEILKGDKISIAGKLPKNLPANGKLFTTIKIPFQKNMMLYLASDGYMDQHGSAARRRLGSAAFKKIIEDIWLFSVEKQKEALEKNLNNWMGNYAQTDDILVVGIKI